LHPAIELGWSKMALKPRPILSEYNVSSNDVLSDEFRVNVTCIRTGRVLWYQDRQLGEDEILEGVYDDRTALRWVIHRPKRGWYIRIRSPAFPPGAFISLSPPAKDTRQAANGHLELGCRTNPWPPPNNAVPIVQQPERTSTSSTSSDHSYPPSSSNSPSSSSHTLVPLPQSQITRFLLKPSIQDTTGSLLWRALARFRQTSSFSILPIDGDHQTQDDESLNLLCFTENSPSRLSSSSGTLAMNESLAAMLGVDKSFWIAVALAYWEFLNERESYLASSEG